MAELLHLADLAAHAGTTQRFTAAVQHVATPKRMRMERHSANSRVASYHVVHLADPTTRFFKLLCWGDTLPTFTRADHADGGDDITTICVGDIVLFSSCMIKTFRGNVEAQYTRHSRVQLLYRRDRYFNTRDVRIKDFFPMIEWYKTQRQTFFADQCAFRGPVTFTSIRDLREEMLVNVRGHIHECKQLERDTTQRVLSNSSDVDGVQLYEVLIEDETGSSMRLNLWDQYSDPRFVSRVLAYRSVIEVLGVVVTHNSVANRLLANTTPRTEFRFGECTGGDESQGDSQASRKDQRFATLESLETASFREGRVVLENVVIEHVLFGRFLGKTDHVHATFTPLLTESYCAVCEQTLPLEEADAIPQVFASCPSGCRIKSGESDRKWRYRTIRMVLRDAQQGRLTVDVGDTVLARLLGDIPAELLIHPQGRGGAVLPFNPNETVAIVLNKMVQCEAEPQLYEVELEQQDLRDQDRRASLLRLNDSVRHEDGTQVDSHTVSSIISLSATYELPW